MDENKNINNVISKMQFGQRIDDKLEINFIDVAYMMLGHWWQILLTVLLCGAISIGITRFCITPLYTASAKIYIVSASNNSLVNLSDLQIGSSLASDYKDLILSRPLLESVVDNLELFEYDIDSEALGEMIDVSTVTDTRILTIKVTSASPRIAADIANEVAKQAIIDLPEIMETSAPHLVESAMIPTKRSSPSYRQNLVIGMLAGALLSCGVLLILYLTNDTFTTPDDVIKYLGIQPLATIPEKKLGDFNDGKGLHRSAQAKDKEMQANEKAGTGSNT